MALKLVTGPDNYPVTLAEAKLHLRVDHSTDDDLIEIFIQAATQYAEGFLGRVLVDQTWDYYADEFPDGAIEIPLPPLIEVVGLFYRDAADVEQEFSASSYNVDTSSQPARVYLLSSGSWPTPRDGANSIRVRFRAGYLDGSVSPAVDAVPFDIKAAILLTIGSLYANRETVVVGQAAVTLPWGAEQLLRTHRIEMSMA